MNNVLDRRRRGCTTRPSAAGRAAAPAAAGHERRPHRDDEHAGHADRGVRARVPDAGAALPAAAGQRRRRRGSGRRGHRARPRDARGRDRVADHRAAVVAAVGARRRRAGRGRRELAAARRRRSARRTPARQVHGPPRRPATSCACSPPAAAAGAARGTDSNGRRSGASHLLSRSGHEIATSHTCTPWWTTQPWSRSAPLHVTGSALVVRPPTQAFCARTARMQAWLQRDDNGHAGRDLAVLGRREGGGRRDRPPRSGGRVPSRGAVGTSHVVIVPVPARPAVRTRTSTPIPATSLRPRRPTRWSRASAACPVHAFGADGHVSRGRTTCASPSHAPPKCCVKAESGDD